MKDTKIYSWKNVFDFRDGFERLLRYQNKVWYDLFFNGGDDEMEEKVLFKFKGAVLNGIYNFDLMPGIREQIKDDRKKNCNVFLWSCLDEKVILNQTDQLGIEFDKIITPRCNYYKEKMIEYVFKQIYDVSVVNQGL